jgi:hypothetical protein
MAIQENKAMELRINIVRWIGADWNILWNRPQEISDKVTRSNVNSESELIAEFVLALPLLPFIILSSTTIYLTGITPFISTIALGGWHESKHDNGIEGSVT